MPFGFKPTCSACKATSSTLWKKDDNEDILCQTCSLNNANNGQKGDSNSSNGDPTEAKMCGNGGGRSGPTVGSHFVGTIRKSARLKPSKYRYQPTLRAIATKGKSRRVIFKKNVSLMLWHCQCH